MTFFELRVVDQRLRLAAPGEHVPHRGDGRRAWRRRRPRRCRPSANIIAPAVAPSGLPVMAIQCRAWSGGFWVGWRCWAGADAGTAESTASARASREGREDMALMLARRWESRQRCLHPLGPPFPGALLRPLPEAVHFGQPEGQLPGGLRPIGGILGQAGTAPGRRARAGSAWSVRAGRRRPARRCACCMSSPIGCLRGEHELPGEEPVGHAAGGVDVGAAVHRGRPSPARAP